MKIFIDAGHNNNGWNTGAIGNGIKEQDVTFETARLCGEILSKYGVDVKLSRPTKETNLGTNNSTSLSERCGLANEWEADYFLSIHYNAGGGTGTETYYKSENGKKFGTPIQNAVVKAFGFRDRGMKKKDDLAVLNNTKMPAALLEVAFLDNTEDAKIIRDRQSDISAAIADGIITGLGITAPPKTIYRVRKTWADAASQIGAFSYLDNAIGYCCDKVSDGYCVFDEKGNKVYPTQAQDEPKITKTPIAGKSVLSAGKLSAYLVSKVPINEQKIPIFPFEFAQWFIAIGESEGIRGDIAFCQAMKETGWLRFGGQVLSEQHNYAGIGATNDSGVGSGAWFSDVSQGITAQIQHLKAYASTETLASPCVDPRFSLVKRGSAPNWEDLNGKWAVPGTTYGQDIVSIYKDIEASNIEPLTQTPNRDTHKQEAVDNILAKIDELRADVEKIKEIL